MMKAYKTLRSGCWLGLVAGLLAAGEASAQNAFLYTNDASATTNIAGTYTDLGSTGTVIATANNDDANSAAQNIGFNFVYGGTTFTQFVLNTNGLMRLGASAPSSPVACSLYGQEPEAGPINSTLAADANLLMPFNFDLGPGTGAPEFRVSTSGTAGSRICTIQWKNMSDKDVPTDDQDATVLVSQIANFSFQVKLYEGSNQIDFVYSAGSAGGTSTLKYAVVGLKGASYNIGSDVLATKPSMSAWSTATFTSGPQIVTDFANAFNFRSVALPDAGRTIRFTSNAACINTAITTFPYNQNFDTPATTAFTCGAAGLDANIDGFTWFKYGDGTTQFSNSAPYSLLLLGVGNVADDWYFTPALRMRAGYSYQLQFKYRGLSGSTDAIEVKAGTASTPAGQNLALFSTNSITLDSYTTTGKLADIKPAVDANYYIGFHGISTVAGGGVFLDDIQVTETRLLAVKNGTNTLFSAEASPVPFGSSLNLNLNTREAGDLHLTMRDALGRTLRQTTAKAVVGSSTIAVPGVADLPAGVYFLDVEQAGQKQMLRVTHE